MSEKALAWIVGDDTGSSSKTIWAVMMGQKPDRFASYPLGAGDLGRCLRLLALVPEWKPRMGEMAALSKYWAALVARWDDLERQMASETGPAFDRRTSAPLTYKLMRSILDPLESTDPTVFKMGNGATIRFGV